jgi:hypothetical protein
MTEYNIRPANKAFYHNGTDKRARTKVSKQIREFIFWDGEGALNPAGRNKSQRYVLLGNSAEWETPLIGEHLSTRDMLQYIISVGRRHPNAWHVGFAFDYDVNMILRSLTPEKFKELKDKGSTFVYQCRIEHVANKWFRITDYTDKTNRFTVTIADMFGFFQCSFVKAIKAYIPDNSLMDQLKVIEEGKEQRNSFTFENISYILNYWQTEIQLGKALADKLRELLYSVGLHIGK